MQEILSWGKKLLPNWQANQIKWNNIRNMQTQTNQSEIGKAEM